ncbi:DUF4377 domain-containing protein [Luteimonas sp. A478]
MARRLSLFLLPLALAACSAQQPPAEPRQPPAPQPAAESSAAPGAADLGAWHWRLTDAVDATGKRIDALFADPGQPLQLDFDEGRVGISGGCNQMGGSYQYEGASLQVSQLVQTQMACAQPLMDQDAAISSLLQDDLVLATEDSDPPRMELTAADGSRLSFQGEPTADTRYGGPGERMFLEVAAQRQPCSHPLINDMQCLQVRELSYDDAGLRSGEPGEWQPLYEEIEGYQHQPGIRNVVRVYRYNRDPVPADASSIVYVHDMTVESSQE